MFEEGIIEQFQLVREIVGFVPEFLGGGGGVLQHVDGVAHLAQLAVHLRRGLVYQPTQPSKHRRQFSATNYSLYNIVNNFFKKVTTV